MRRLRWSGGRGDAHRVTDARIQTGHQARSLRSAITAWRGRVIALHAGEGDPVVSPVALWACDGQLGP